MSTDTNQPTAWDAERIPKWRRVVNPQRRDGVVAVGNAEFLALLDELESARETARIDREQCDAMTKGAAEMAAELERVRQERDRLLLILANQPVPPFPPGSKP